jgi:hypothetical protein
MVKLVDTLGLGSNSSKRLRVQVPFLAQKVYSSEVEQLAFNLKVLGSIPNILSFQQNRVKVARRAHNPEV